MLNLHFGKNTLFFVNFEEKKIATSRIFLSNFCQNVTKFTFCWRYLFSKVFNYFDQCVKKIGWIYILLTTHFFGNFWKKYKFATFLHFMFKFLPRCDYANFLIFMSNLNKMLQNCLFAKNVFLVKVFKYYDQCVIKFAESTFR